MKYLQIIIIYFITIPAFSQQVARGRVLSLPGRQPISFVNIGIVDSPVGTISDEDGTFELRIPEGYTRDTVIISAVGYKSMRIPVKALLESARFKVFLKESVQILKTVTIKDETWKRRVFKMGNRKMEGSIMIADTGTAGSAIALLIKNPPPGSKSHFEYPIYAERAELNIYNNTFPEFKIRIRLCDVDKNTGMPGEDLLNESVVTRSAIDSGNLRIKLSNYKLEIKGDFFLVFEWILDKNDRKSLVGQFEEFRTQHPDKVNVDYSFIDGKKIHYLNYLGNLFAGPSFGISVSRRSLQNNICYYRLNSFGEWKRSASILTANITLSDQPSWTQNTGSITDTTYDGTNEDLLSYYSMEPLGPGLTSTKSVLLIQDSSITGFRQRTEDPVSIEVHRIDNQLMFSARNPSLYPYRLEMNFNGIINLMPIPGSKSFILKPGYNRLLTLNVVDPSIPDFHYNLSVKEIPGDTTLIPERKFPYLIPTGRHEAASQVVSIQLSENPRDIFEVSNQDTVYAMRKGLVTALPGQNHLADRVYADGTLEVYHSDGTIMVYKNLDPSKILIKEGDPVYPGQPLGVLLKDMKLETQLYHLTRSGGLCRMEINYYTGDTPNRPITGINNEYIIEYADSIVMKEMTEKEIESFKRNTLYRR